MPKTQPKKNFQIRRMFGLAKPFAEVSGRDTKEYIEEVVFCQIERNPNMSDLTFDEANKVIIALGGEPFRAYGNSKRNENYKKQQAGVKSIETDNHLNFIDELARLRGMTPEGVEKLATRMRLPWPPRTTAEGNKIVEALKAMNKRDGLSHSATGTQESAEPKFRRVA